ncbi:unnamed protein product [Alternaria alternata]
MSSLWGDRFESTASVAPTYVQCIDTSVNIHDVLATVYDHLPHIPIGTLTADKSLGTGSMFHVRHEIYDEGLDPPLKYHVAVKYIRTEHSPGKQRQIMRSLLRELRTITHPMIRGHPHVISALGYGWTDMLSQDPRPFLVMEYADFGTLSNHLQAMQLHAPMPMKERYHLALDVSCGLQALHLCGLIHGDVKTSNVLVCHRSSPLGYSSDDLLPWMAKLADFGSSLTKEEANEHVFQYTGTSLYNAPEIEVSDCGFTNRGSFIDYKMADVYSFGLLLWEVMHGGTFYLRCLGDDHDLLRKKRYTEFLIQIHQGKDDKLLRLAIESLRDSKVELENTNHGACWLLIVEALTLTLQTRGPVRGSAEVVYHTLRKGISDATSPIVYSLPRLRSGPPRKPYGVGSSVFNRPPSKETGGHVLFTPLHGSLKAGPNGQVFRAIGKATRNKPEQRILPFTGLDCRDAVKDSSTDGKAFSVHRADMVPRPPWAIQKQKVAKWYADVAENHDSATVSDAYLRLSACRLLGFGLDSDWTECLDLLRKALPGSSMAKAIYPRVAGAMKSDGNAEQDRPAPGITTFSHRIYKRLSSIVITPNMFRTPQLSIQPRHEYSAPRASSILAKIKADIPNSMSLKRLEYLWTQGRVNSMHYVPNAIEESLSQLDISVALTEACKARRFDLAKALAAMCVQFIGPRGEPTPLHWLIMFPPDEADHLARLLISGSAEDEDESLRLNLCKCFNDSYPQTRSTIGGICHNLVNAQTDGGVYLPEHCLELIGTPLHWAVRCNNLRLVRTLLTLGADLSTRCKVRNRQLGEPTSSVSFNYSPLDIAIEFHLYEIVTEILDRTQHNEVPMEIGASLIARTTTTWSRFVIHGASYQFAIRSTIRALQKVGWAMERQDHFGEIPVLVALANSAEERYIIKELLLATRRLPELPFPEKLNLGTFLVTRSDTEYASGAWKFGKVLPLIDDLNGKSNGFNMLHYCAILGNPHIADMLLSTRRVNIEDGSVRSTATHSCTPLMYAAEFGQTEVARLLLEAGANIEGLGAAGQRTPLETAILNRHFSTASLLIESGANLDFRTVDEVHPHGSVLHAACIQSLGRAPIVKRLLDVHPKLRHPSILNRVVYYGKYAQTSALWQAVYYADLESVRALLDYGADPNMPYNHTPRRLVDLILKGSQSPFRLDQGQMRAALHGDSESMRTLRFSGADDRIRERALLEATDTIAQYNFRLEDMQAADQSKAGIRAFIDRLLEIRKLLDEHTEIRK